MLSYVSRSWWQRPSLHAALKALRCGCTCREVANSSNGSLTRSTSSMRYCTAACRSNAPLVMKRSQAYRDVLRKTWQLWQYCGSIVGLSATVQVSLEQLTLSRLGLPSSTRVLRGSKAAIPGRRFIALSVQAKNHDELIDHVARKLIPNHSQQWRKIHCLALTRCVCTHYPLLAAELSSHVETFAKQQPSGLRNYSATSTKLFACTLGWERRSVSWPWVSSRTRTQRHTHARARTHTRTHLWWCLLVSNIVHKQLNGKRRQTSFSYLQPQVRSVVEDAWVLDHLLSARQGLQASMLPTSMPQSCSELRAASLVYTS